MWQLAGNTGYANAFILGENMEKIPRRSILGGTDLTFQKVTLQMNLAGATACPNPINCYITALLDTVIIVDVNSGDVTALI